MNFTNGASLLSFCEENHINLSEAMLRREAELTETSREEIFGRMRESYAVMRESVRRAQESGLSMLGGFIGGESRALLARLREKGAVSGLTSLASAYAMGVLEVNASMGRIVAAPTAGASGVLPGILVAAEETYGYSEENLVMALFNAGAVGYLVARNACISGAQGGCQAEVGTASAMAASALCELMGGTPRECLAAAGDAIANILGLVCDPICGLVEAPCQKRNAMGVSNAIICTEIALATGGKTLVPFDEVVEAMYSVGKSIPYQLRETALGGMAAAESVKNRKPACAECSMGRQNS